MTRRKRKLEEEAEKNVGLVLTVALFLILLTFFILLNSIAVLDENRTRTAIGSLIGAFGNLSGGLSPLKTGEEIMPPSPPLMEKEFDVSSLMNIMSSAMSGRVRIQSTSDKEVISIQEEFLFEDSDLSLKPSSLPFLDKICSLIGKGDYPIEIVGHTDSRPGAEKGGRSNWELSSLMAIKVLRYMVEKRDVPTERITAYGCSSYKNAAPNDTKASRARNRKIDIILNYEAPEYVKRIYRRKPSGTFSYKKFDFKIF